MPGFVSHTVMANKVYNKIDKKNVNLEYMLTYSLGGDLTKYAKCRYDTHHKNQQLFIDNMIKYIKDNHLQNDKEKRTKAFWEIVIIRNITLGISIIFFYMIIVY